jgi:GNAT superfamily N-acetyltransferase
MATNPESLARFSLRVGTDDDLAILMEIDATAGVLFEQAGLFLDLPEDHEFSIAERRHLIDSLRARTALLAIDQAGYALGFIAVHPMDGDPYIAQLSVRPPFMRLGIGSTLLAAACEISRKSASDHLWLTTYGHLPWNRPFYERNGFEIVPLLEIGPELRAVSDLEQRVLPLPHERIVMRKDLRTPAR